MTILEGLREHLLSSTTWRGEQIGTQIAALVGTRVYPLRLPQKPTLPAIVLLQVSDRRPGHLRGAASLGRPRYQVDCWATTHDAAVALGALCRRRLEGFTGAWTDGGSPAITIRVMNIQYDTGGGFFEEDIQGGLCRKSDDYFIYHSTAAGVL